MVESSPHLEAFRDKGYEVLYLVDPIDEFVTQSLTEFEEKKFRSANKGDVELGSKEEREKAKEESEAKQKDYADLLKKMQEALDEHVKEVRISKRLTTSPACLVSGEFDMSPHLERLMRQTEGGLGMPSQKRILEVNPDHDLLTKLKARFDADSDDSVVAEYAGLLHGHALIAEGSELPDPAAYNRLVGELMLRGI